MKKITILLLLCIGIQAVTAQQKTYGIYFPKRDRQTKCNYFLQAFQQKPKEIRFGIKTEGNNLYFEINDKRWLDQLFKKTGDGIAVDVVSKKRYSCNQLVADTQIRGTLLPPVYAMQLKRKLKKARQNNYRVWVGKIPENLKEEDLEFNILFLQNKSLCQYYNIYNLQAYAWDLLDMGVYLDSLTYKNQKITTVQEKIVTKYKTLKFTIPFEKNKAEYKPEDIKPMYDSLRLTNFNIKTIEIKAYASVEGSVERNIKLQEQRATSIANSLQSFQQPSIATTVSSSENWVEFLNDIKNTSFATLIPLSKKETKAKLVGSLAQQIEPILKHHRKAVVTLSLEKKDKYKKLTVEELVNRFNTAIQSDDIAEATAIQNSILAKVRETLSPDALTQMNIPKQKKYITLLTKNSMVKYLMNISQTLIVQNELLALEKLDPKNKRIQYNLAVLKFIIWRNKAGKINKEKFKKEIIALKNVGIPQVLIDRMLVNYHIIKAQEDLQSRKYDEKDESVEFILDTYENFPLSNYDYLSLAQFLTYYSNIYDAIEVLEDKVKEITVDEDLLFYYLNLTLTNRDLVKTAAYKTTVLNAINMNPKRFCAIFNPSLEGGVTFQLLENIELRVLYCESCTQQP
ncbi:OmpA family protein [Tenacibaculum agarivorans]|uniref:hypothetical protein n=1 Tax=Tenacibaculum agarivorans TaxID=1908389 RepID=UPI00094BBFA4|nr:hypothetical protein [Tenacibaculum agarivorans]